MKPEGWLPEYLRSSWDVCWVRLLASSMPPDNIVQMRHYYRQRYMASKRWKQLRQDKLQQADHKCELCGTTPDKHKLDVHHLTYQRLGGELLSDLQVLCYQCHGKAHYRPKHA
jgi:5-methylcytosine-specific restriction endonuclease McrA